MERNKMLDIVKFLGYYLVSQLLLIGITPKRYFLVSVAISLWYTYLIINPVYVTKTLEDEVITGMKKNKSLSNYMLPYDIGFIEPKHMAIQIIVNTILNLMITILLGTLLVYIGGF